MLLKVEPRDMLPNRICLKCKSSLDCAYEFYVTCVEVDLALKIQLEAEDSENVSLFSKTSLCSLIKISKLVKIKFLLKITYPLMRLLLLESKAPFH